MSRFGSDGIFFGRKSTSDPISNLIASLGNVGTSGFSRSQPDDVYVSFTLDVSKSLINDHDTKALMMGLEASDGVLSPTGYMLTPGDNGTVPPANFDGETGNNSWGGEVWPAYPVVMPWQENHARNWTARDSGA